MRPGLTRRRFLATTVGAAAGAPGVSAFAAPTEGADLIFRGGPIIPMVGDSRTVEALASRTARSQPSVPPTP